MKNYVLLIILILTNTTAISIQNNEQTEVDQQVLKLLHKYSFNGSAMVASANEVLAHHSLGIANAETKQTLNNQSAFALGSVTKEFNAVAIMMLHEKGMLNINHALSEYFPTLPAWSRKVKIKHLLNYTSGLPRVDFRQIQKPADLNTQVEELASLAFEPGEGYLYSNHNVFLQIKIIELVSKQTYTDFLREHVFLPLNMRHSYLNNEKPQQIVKSFSQSGENAPDMPFPIAAIVHSTAVGMHAWLHGLHSEKLINEESLQVLFESYDANSESPLGVGLANQKQEKYHFHQGSHFNFESIIYYDIDTDKSIVLLTNSKTGNLYELFLQIKALIS